MSISTPSLTSEIVYPDSDGQRIADNTLQFDWIVKIKHGLDTVFRDRSDVFVAADLLWYPVEGRPDIRTAPDALVALGRPKGDRGSYKQWEDEGIAPQVVFEVLSPGNRAGRIVQKFKFYERYGVGEFYVYDPHENELTGWLRNGNELEEIQDLTGWTSPRLGIRFDPSGSELTIYGPNGQRFLTYQELADERDRLTQERDRMIQERDRMIQERDRVAGERDRVAKEIESQRQRIERTAAQRREMGLEPPS